MNPMIIGIMVLLAYLAMFAGVRAGPLKTAMLALTGAVALFALASAIFEIRFDFEPALSAMVNRLMYGVAALAVIAMAVSSFLSDAGRTSKSSSRKKR